MSGDEFSGRSLPLAVGVARGVRAFDVDKQGRLVGVTFRKAWRPGENVAECLRSDWMSVYKGVVFTIGSTSASAPTTRELTANTNPHDMSTCGHGFYGYYDGSNDYRRDSRVSGVVEGYGECLIGTRGFRASRARIVALHLPERRPVRRWLSRWRMTAAAAALAGFLGGTGALALIGGESSGWFSAGIGAVWLSIAVIEGVKARGTAADEDGVAPKLQALIRRNYPDVPVFSSFEAMVAVFPPDRSLASTPESDDKFWERAS